MHTFRTIACCATSLAIALSACSIGCKGKPANSGASGPPAEETKEPASAKAAAPSGLRVALVMKTMTNPFFQRMKDGAQKKADELGVELMAVTPARETDIDEQANKVRDMIQSKVDAILIAPAGSKEIVPVLVEAKEAGIIVINLDNRVDAEASNEAGLELDAYVGADNEEGGYMAGEYLLELLEGKGTVTMVEGIPSADNAIARRKGFERAMSGQIGMTMLKPFQSGHWDQEEAYNIMTNLLQTHPEITGLFCANDMMALGAMRAIEDAGKPGHITVVSYDNLPEVEDALKSGALAATVEQNPEKMGSFGVEFAVKLKNGEEVEKEYLVPLELAKGRKAK